MVRICIGDRCEPNVKNRRAALIAVCWPLILGRSMTALGLLLTISSSAIALEADSAAWTEATRKAGLDDPRMLQAIAFAESGRTDDHGLIEPWPWALNIEGQAFFPTSQEEAMTLLSAHQDRSVDVGPAADQHPLARPSRR